jgi:hypothetical protein
MEIYNKKKREEKVGKKAERKKNGMDEEIDLAKNPQVSRSKQSNEDVAEFIENVSKCESIENFN